ncbi:CDP-alcohol phosphatidyltransferase family protein [Actinoplanes sp. NPDC051633]|uniref:CDP-alcohol phosphatidyltransferase family protein n=1 Tax=Actinoplanes sp. NPDC051633 TaxID=3155670 RepID=UPI00344134D3
MVEKVSLAEVRERTYKDRDAWWTVWLVDPLASRLVRLVAPWPAVTPNRLTVGAFLLGLGAALCFWQQSWGWLIAGAALFHLSFVLDCMDGKIARLNGTGSVFGAWLDYVFDRLRVLACTIALMGGQFARTQDLVYLWLGGLVIFLDMFRYLNALQMNKVKDDMKDRLATAGEKPIFLEEAAATTVHPAGLAETGSVVTAAGKDGVERPVVDVYGEFRGRFGAFTRLRNRLIGQRIRAHLFSGIEFQMFVFIVGPLTHQIIGVTVASAVLLIGFELLLIYKLWTATKTFTSRLTPTVVTQRVRESETAVPLP